MKKVENGKFVKVEYTGRLENGDVFDSNKNSHPIEVEVGAGKLIQGFEDALVGMEEKEKKNFTLSPEEGYGKRNEELLQKYDGLVDSQYASSSDKLKKLVFELEVKEKKILDLTQQKTEVGLCKYF